MEKMEMIIMIINLIANILIIGVVIIAIILYVKYKIALRKFNTFIKSLMDGLKNNPISKLLGM